MNDGMDYFGLYESPIGWIEIKGSENGVLSVKFVDQPKSEFATRTILEMAIRQISEYFMGTRRTFDLPLAMHGTNFQRQVWGQLMTIPYGKVATYQEIAKAIGRPQAIRAVGAANARNPISIIVPCHRVIGKDGSLTGYGGGIWRKEWLLRHEGYL
jgi:methylated-DNA-[protein]-cysteine S-methyltransferase